MELKDKPLAPLMSQKSLLITPKKVILSLFALLLVLAIIYFWKEIGYLIEPPALQISQPREDITVNQEQFEIIGKTNPFAVVNIKGEQIYVDKDGNFKKEFTLSMGLNTFQIEAKNRFGKINTIIRRIIYNP